MSPGNEASFEAHIAGWLVEYGGYQRLRNGNVGVVQPDFDPVAGVDGLICSSSSLLPRPSAGITW